MSERFLFDQEFDGSGRTRARGKAEMFTEDDIAAAKAQAFAEGQQQAETAAQQAMDAHVGTVLASIAEQLRDLKSATLDMVEGQRRDATDIAVAIGRRLSESLIERQPLAEIEGMIAECVGRLSEEPRLVIRTSEPVSVELRDRIDGIGEAAGFQGHLVLLPDDGLSDQDCRVEWADGGAERNMNQIKAEIDSAVTSYLSSMQG